MSPELCLVSCCLAHIGMEMVGSPSLSLCVCVCIPLSWQPNRSDMQLASCRPIAYHPPTNRWFYKRGVALQPFSHVYIKTQLGMDYTERGVGGISNRYGRL